jgi:hypothetical protein
VLFFCILEEGQKGEKKREISTTSDFFREMDFSRGCI